MLTLRQAERELTWAAGSGPLGDAAEIWRSEIDSLRPAESISTLEVATKYRRIKTDDGQDVGFDIELTPYMEEPHEEIDNPDTWMVAIKGPARGGKTMLPENYLLKIGRFGPSKNVLWLMHSEPDVKRYVKERVDPFMELHPEVGEKVQGKNPAWNMRIVDGQVWEWAPANPSTTRARSASFIAADEIDAMRPSIRNAILTLIRNRQREFKRNAKAWVGSHPDAGPNFGIDSVIAKSDCRIRLWTCPHCAHRFSPAVEAEQLGVRHITWNMSKLFKLADELTDDALFEVIEQNIRLECPNIECGALFDDVDRLAMDSKKNGACWIGKGQTVDEFENVVGERQAAGMGEYKIAGFVVHAFMAPFVTLAGLAREWAEAKLDALRTGDTALLKEVTVKSLGETFREDVAGSRPRIWTQVKNRLIQPPNRIGEVPDGCEFLIGVADIQGNRFEIGVIGFSRYRESWLIDRYAIKQKPGARDLQPADVLRDWDVLNEGPMRAWYPLARNHRKQVAENNLGLRIAKFVVDTGGSPSEDGAGGVFNNARMWAANLLARNEVPAWKLLLMKGDAHIRGELVQKQRIIEKDVAGRPLATPVIERTFNVSDIKKIIATRMEYDQGGAPDGLMHLPVDVLDKHVRELCSETFDGKGWIQKGRNETWDHWVAAEGGRIVLAPDNADIKWDANPPVWARPVRQSRNVAVGDMPLAPDYLQRLRDLNLGRR